MLYKILICCVFFVSACHELFAQKNPKPGGAYPRINGTGTPTQAANRKDTSVLKPKSGTKSEPGTKGGANPRISGAGLPTQAANRKTNNNVGPIKIKILTDSGTIVVQLSDSTPLHRDNFVKLVKQGFYDSLMFHRVIPQFMIQGGDPTSKYASTGTGLGNGGGDMARIPAEFNPNLFHRKGVLAAARDGNPEKASSACQFYLVEGKVQTQQDLDMYEQRTGIKYSPAQRAAYTTIGGTPQLDMNYTVFGEVISGLEVISKIVNVPRDRNNRPLGDVRMRVEMLQ